VTKREGNKKKVRKGKKKEMGGGKPSTGKISKLRHCKKRYYIQKNHLQGNFSPVSLGVVHK